MLYWIRRWLLSYKVLDSLLTIQIDFIFAWVLEKRYNFVIAHYVIINKIVYMYF
jgi:hypothetical protein